MTKPTLTRSRQASLILLSMLGVFVLLRVYLHLSPSSNLDVAGYNIHHLFTGILLLIGAAIPLVLNVGRAATKKVLSLVFGAGLALVLDEWVYLIATDGSDSAYLLPVSVLGAVLIIAGVGGYVYYLGRK